MLLTLDHFHDDELRDIRYARERRQLRLDFAHDDSTSSIFFEGVLHFRISNYIDQNVVGRLFASITDGSGGQTLSPQAVDEYIDWIFADSYPMSDGAKRDLSARVIRGDVALLAVSPSLGAEFAVLSESFSLACACEQHDDSA